jgi:hypothetical protein
MKRFRDLPKAQSFVFEQIAINNDAGHHPATLKALMKKGLIEETRERQGAFSIFRYHVPIPIHMEWCNWCSKQPGNELSDDP